jgi:hypothetical protein
MLRACFILLATCLLALPARAEAPHLGLPVACALGSDCAVQNYVDTDPGPAWADFTCGAMSYDAHDGTDFRIADLDMLKAGIPVLAAADGKVLRTRDGMADGVYRKGTSDIPETRACGNGMIVDHGDGWTTQYCHLRKGSIAVRSGDAVKAGSLLGYIGQSGRAEFPHVHFEVAHDGKPVDPFTADPSGAAPPIVACGTGGNGLWQDAVARALAYRAPLVLNAGFAAGRIEMDDIDTRARTIQRLIPDTPALVFYGRAIGMSAGDLQRITITAPDGTGFVRNDTEPEQRNRAQVMAFAGRKRPPGGWATGPYTARYQLIRDGRVIAERSETIALAP